MMMMMLGAEKRLKREQRIDVRKMRILLCDDAYLLGLEVLADAQDCFHLLNLDVGVLIPERMDRNNK